MSISYFNNAHPDPDVANREQSSFHIADGIGEHKKASRQRACVVEVTVLHQLMSTYDSFVSVQRLSCCFEPKSFFGHYVPKGDRRTVSVIELTFICLSSIYINLGISI